MLFGILSLSATAYAAENKEKEVDVTTADYPIMIKDRINTARLTKIGQYSELTEEEKDAVCKYYSLEDSIFVACENAGYNILDSVRIARASIAAEVTPAEYKEYVNAYGSEEEASFQLQIYRLFEDKLDADYKAEYVELMKEGYSHIDLRNTYDVAKTIDVSINSIVPDTPEHISVAKAETELEKFAAKNFCDVTKLQKAVVSKNINTAELIEGKKPDIVKSKEITISAESDLSQTAEVTAAASNSFEIDSIFDIKGVSFEIGGSASPIKIGPLSVGAGYEYSVSIGENKFDGNIYSATAGASLLPVDGHAQISFSAFDSRIETILATILLKTLKTVFDR